MSIVSRPASGRLYPIAQRDAARNAYSGDHVQTGCHDETRLLDLAAAASAHYASIEAARLGAAELMREERILKVMIVKNAFPGGFVEWIDR